MGNQARQPAGRQGTGVLSWTRVNKYYLDSVGGRYRISKINVSDGTIYLAFCRERRQWVDGNNPKSWSAYDTGLIAKCKTARQAMAVCEQYEFDYQASNVDGMYYGVGFTG